MIETSIYSLLTAAISASVPLASMKISAVDGSAFIDCGSLGALVFARAGELLTVTDSAGKTITGYIKAAGTGETLSDNAIQNNADFSSDEPPGTAWTLGTGWTVAGGVAVAADCINGAYIAQSVAKLAGQLYKAKYDIKSISEGSVSACIATSESFAPQAAPADNIEGYLTAIASGTTRFGLKQRGTAGAQMSGTFDNLSIKQVLAPAATGVTIVSTPGGSVFNWKSKDAAFNYADAFGYTISRPLSGRVYPVVMSQDVILPAISYQRISADPANTLSGASGLVNAHIVINSWARTYDEAKALALEVRTAMNAATAFKSLLVNELDGYDPDVMLFVVSQDFSVWGSE